MKRVVGIGGRVAGWSLSIPRYQLSSDASIPEMDGKVMESNGVADGRNTSVIPRFKAAAFHFTSFLFNLTSSSPPPYKRRGIHHISSLRECIQGAAPYRAPADYITQSVTRDLCLGRLSQASELISRWRILCSAYSQFKDGGESEDVRRARTHA